jgi:hypothetical protein
VPWDPDPRPAPDAIAAIGRTLPQSPVGRFCAELADGPLDGTLASFVPLDAYLDLVAPREAPPDPAAAWSRRVATLIGAYVGETVRQLAGGEWAAGSAAASSPGEFRVVLRGSVDATPVAHAFDRVTGVSSTTLVDYARGLVRQAGRPR